MVCFSVLKISQRIFQPRPHLTSYYRINRYSSLNLFTLPVKTNLEFAQEIGISEFPSIVYYEHGNPHIYDGNKTYPIVHCTVMRVVEFLGCKSKEVF